MTSTVANPKNTHKVFLPMYFVDSASSFFVVKNNIPLNSHIFNDDLDPVARSQGNLVTGSEAVAGDNRRQEQQVTRDPVPRFG